jgi:hypothetical protein
MIKTQNLPKYLAFLLLTVVSGSDLVISQVLAQSSVQSSIGKSVTFTCNDSEAKIKAKNGPKVTFGPTTIYIGYQQISSKNQDPRIIRFDNGFKTWCRSDYETTNDDSRGYGLLWNGGNALYGVFSTTGTQSGNDFRRFAKNSWLSGYGNGGGAKIAVIARINPANGNIYQATFLSAKRPSDGRTNSLEVKNLSWNGSNLTVKGDAWWSPRRPDKNIMNCAGSSPFKYTTVFSGDLTKVTSSSAVNCN